MRTRRQGGLSGLFHQQQTIPARRRLGSQFITIAALAGISSVIFGVVGAAPQRRSSPVDRDQRDPPVIVARVTALPSDPYEPRSVKAEIIGVSDVLLAAPPPTLEHATSTDLRFSDPPPQPSGALGTNIDHQAVSADLSASDRPKQPTVPSKTNIDVLSLTEALKPANVPLPPRRPRVFSEPAEVPSQVASLSEPVPRAGPEGTR